MVATERGFGAGYGCQPPPLPSSMARTRCGWWRVPPLATVIAITASEIGVTETWPWPIETEIVSPAYHFSLYFCRFHAVDGMMPWISLGRSMPDISPRPSAEAHLCMRSTPSRLPTE